MEHKFSVILAEDELLIRKDIIQKIHAINSNFQVIASAANGRDALSLVREHKPDLLITDIQMPILDGIELIKQIRTQFPEMNIIIISGFDNFQYAQTALKYNVMDYLLKPVDSNTFSCLLSDLEGKLKLQNESEQREILLRDLKGLPVQNHAIQQYVDSRFGIYLINVGNLHLKTGVSLQQEEYYTIIESDHFIEACNKVLSHCEQIFVMDERLPNQKCILVIQPDTTYDSRDRAIKLHQTLNTICSPVPVSICAISDPVTCTEIRATVGNLRKLMETTLLLCRGELFIHDQAKNIPADINTDLMCMRFSKLIQNGDYARFNNEFNSYFLQVIEMGYTQRQIENILIRLITHLASANDGVPTADIDNAIQRIYEICAFNIEYRIILKQITETILQLCGQDKQTAESGKEAVEQIADFLKANFRNQISIENLSDYFRFNSSYLIRLFNKYMKVTPAQYIINLRIDEAKRLLKLVNKLSLKQIAEFCGYGDQHYFSRLFKQVTGVTPSAYRETENTTTPE